jgi:hypothetical protein
MGVQIFIAIARDVAVARHERNNRVIRIAVIVASGLRRTRKTGAPAAPTASPDAGPGGFGRNSQ